MKITWYQMNKVREMLKNPKEIGEDFKHITPEALNKAVKNQILPLPDKDEENRCIYCGIFLHPDDDQEICWTCYQMKFGEIISGEEDLLLMEQKV